MARRIRSHRHDEDVPMAPCDICMRMTACGLGVWRGSKVQQWDMWVCDSCRLTDDVPPIHASRVAKLLVEKGISYAMTAKGTIAIPK
jgi:hypothetical protein